MIGRPNPLIDTSVDAAPERAPEPSATPPTPDVLPTRRRGSWPSWVAMAALITLLGVLIWRVASPPDELTAAEVNAVVAKAIQKAQDDARSAPSEAAAAYTTIAPSMVTVTVRAGAASGGASGAPSTPSASASAQRANGLGSGVVIGQDGSVLTALHVVKGAGTIEVIFADGTRSAASVAKSDSANDIAVLKPAKLPQVVVPAVLGGAVAVGDPVFAVGNPFGLTSSLTVGAVSALGRSITPDGGAELKNLIQFDAAVNPGSSGGPLLNRGGQVVGVVTGLANPADQAFFVGIGFAVPIATAAAAAGGGQK